MKPSLLSPPVRGGVCLIILLSALTGAAAAPSTPADAGDLQRVLAFEVFFDYFTIGELLLSFGTIVVTLLFRNVLAKMLFRKLASLSRRTRTEHDDRFIEALEAPVSLLILVFGLYLAILVLLTLETHGLVNRIFKGITMVLVFWATLRLVDLLAHVLSDISDQRGLSIAGFVPLIKKAIRIFVLLIGIVMVIDNLGYSVGGLLATLGLGGAALAFAAKDTIANLYGSLALVLDRPFKVGDWIMVGKDIDGDVEEIGLRSTKVRTWPKTIMSIPNSVLANETINNWSRMPKRRVKQVIGVTYDTSPDDMDGLVEDIRNLLREDEDIEQEFILVNFTDFGDSSLNILVYYFTKTIQWLDYMDVRQRMNLKIMRAVEQRGLSIAFPTRTVHLAGDGTESLLEPDTGIGDRPVRGSD